jgi:hypothetical protein
MAEGAPRSEGDSATVQRNGVMTQQGRSQVAMPMPCPLISGAQAVLGRHASAVRGQQGDTPGCAGTAGDTR